MIYNHHIINKKYKELFFPSLFMCMAINVSLLIISAFVGSKLGYLALSTIQILIPLTSFVLVIEYMFAIGGQILCSNFKTKYEEEKSNKYFTISTVTLIAICCLIAVFGVIFLDNICKILSPSGELVPYLKGYLPYILISFPLMTYVMALSQFIRIDNYPNLATVSLVSANILNIIFAWTFVSLLNWGMFGAGISSIISYVIGALIITTYMFRNDHHFKFNFDTNLKTWFKAVSQICRTGFPSASTQLYSSLITLLMNIIILAYLSNQGLATFGICTDALLIVSIITIGIVETMLAILTISYSKKDYATVKHLFTLSSKIAIVACLVLTAYILIFPESFIGLFISSGNKSFIEIAITPIRLYSLSLLPVCLGNILLFYTQSLQKTTIASIIPLVSILVGPLMFTFILIPIIGYNGIWISFALGALLAIVIAIVYAFKSEHNEESSYMERFLYLDSKTIKNSQNFTIRNEEKKEFIEDMKKQMGNKVELLDDILEDVFKDEPNKEVNIFVLKESNQTKVDLTYEGKISFKDNYKDIDYTNILGLNNIQIILNE